MVLTRLFINLLFIIVSVTSVSATWYRCKTPCSGASAGDLTESICNKIGGSMKYCAFAFTYYCDVGDINGQLAYAFEGRCNTCRRNGVQCSGNCDYAAACPSF